MAAKKTGVCEKRSEEKQNNESEIKRSMAAASENSMAAWRKSGGAGVSAANGGINEQRRNHQRAGVGVPAAMVACVFA